MPNSKYNQFYLKGMKKADKLSETMPPMDYSNFPINEEDLANDYPDTSLEYKMPDCIYCYIRDPSIPAIKPNKCDNKYLERGYRSCKQCWYIAQYDWEQPTERRDSKRIYSVYFFNTDERGVMKEYCGNYIGHTRNLERRFNKHDEDYPNRSYYRYKSNLTYDEARDLESRLKFANDRDSSKDTPDMPAFMREFQFEELTKRKDESKGKKALPYKNLIKGKKSRLANICFAIINEKDVEKKLMIGAGHYNTIMRISRPYDVFYKASKQLEEAAIEYIDKQYKNGEQFIVTPLSHIESVQQKIASLR